MTDRFEHMTEDQLRAECRRLDGLINHPLTDSFLDGVRREAAHQSERWGSEHDAGKAPLDWFWLVGYLAQKVVVSLDRLAETNRHFAPGEGIALKSKHASKALHHTISTAAVCLNWHAHIVGTPLDGRKSFQPGTNRQEQHDDEDDRADGPE